MRISEREFVEKVRREAARTTARWPALSKLRQGIGDDCAVIAHSQRKDLLVTTDLFLEEIHFRREWQSSRSIGRKALARAFSDIAAMGGTPLYTFLSLALPAGIGQSWVQGFLRGFLELAEAEKVILAGGDTGASRNGVLADVIVIGEVPRNQAIRRSGASAGDELWVTGTLGKSALGLSLLRSGEKLRGSQVSYQTLFYPQPRLRMGRYLQERQLATAMIDLSDGLSIDLGRLCKASGVGARVVEEAIPRFPPVTLEQALHGGEDLELLFTVPPERSPLLPKNLGGIPLARIGKIISGRKLWLVRGQRNKPLPLLGFQHF